MEASRIEAFLLENKILLMIGFTFGEKRAIAFFVEYQMWRKQPESALRIQRVSDAIEVWREHFEEVAEGR